MSAGNFVRSRYESDDGTVFSIRVQPETLAANVGAANAGAAGAVDGVGSARARGSRRQIGVIARSVTVAFTGALPTDYAENQTHRIPIMTPSVYNGASIGTTGTYLGVPIEVVGKNPESVR